MTDQHNPFKRKYNEKVQTFSQKTSRSLKLRQLMQTPGTQNVSTSTKNPPTGACRLHSVDREEKEEGEKEEEEGEQWTWTLKEDF